MGADNPDNLYQNAPISGKLRVRDHGQPRHRALPRLRHAGRQLRRDRQPRDHRLPRGLAISTLGADGNFEIVGQRASSSRANWLPMTRGQPARWSCARPFSTARREEPAQIRIERIDGPHRPRPLVPPRALDRGLARAGASSAAARSSSKPGRAMFQQAPEHAAASSTPQWRKARRRRSEHRLLPQLLAARAGRGARDRRRRRRRATTGTSSSTTTGWSRSTTATYRST